MTPDEVLDSVATQRRGQALLATLAVYVKKREESLLASLVAASNAGTLSGDAARDGIAGIAALRGLVRDIERDVRTATHQSQALAANKE